MSKYWDQVLSLVMASVSVSLVYGSLLIMWYSRTRKKRSDPSKEA
jgi:hypothetical protein